MKSVSWFAGIILIVAGCHSSSTTSNATHNSAAPIRVGEVRVGRYGIGCRTYQAPDLVGPPSYLVRDIGREGVPTLSPGERRIARRIREYLKSPNLRFARLPDRPRFVIFDATQGPCADFAGGYHVLNTSNTNLYYEPGEAPGFVHSGAAGGVVPTPGPWMPRPSRQT